MATTLEVKYFNSFVLKKTSTSPDGVTTPVWNGSFGMPQNIGGYPRPQATPIYNGISWIVEEARIRGGYNNASTGYGVRAYLVEEEPNASIRFNSMIYSGVYNSRTGINNTNVFSVGDEITRSLDPINGSIQKLYAEDTNLIIFQESKVSKALIDKDAIYSAEGGGLPVSSFTTVIGQIVPYLGNYGMGNHPESFAVYGYNKYFVDSYQNTVMRLGRDGLTEISATGMRSFFRNRIIGLDSIFGKGKLIGGWDIYNKDYVLSIQPSNPGLPKETVNYDEKAKGWISKYTYIPDQSFSLKNQHYTTTGSELYIHNSTTVPINNFYGTQRSSQVVFVFNPKVSSSKIFNTVNYEGSSGWQVDSFISDETGPSISSQSSFDSTNNVLSYVQGAYDSATPSNTGTSASVPPIFRAGFYRKENKYCANLINNSSPTNGEILFGKQVSGIKGFFAVVTVSTDNITDQGGYKELFAVSSNYTFANGY
tara:strand:- start:30 stop:1469 length:1440 start_codon:yes stop_codon:yes gene_type:complete